MKRGIVTFLILVAIPFFCVHAYSSPGKPDGFVSDFAKVLSPEEQTRLETTLAKLATDTQSEIAVVIVPTLGSEETIDTYAVALFEEWDIGKKGVDNGLLLLVAIRERQVRIEVGYGLEGDVTDTQASQIIRTILTPAFQVGDYGRGIEDAVGVLSGLILKNPDILPKESESRVQLSEDWIYFIVLIPVWLASILGRSKSWWAGGVIGGVVGFVIGIVFGTLIIGGLMAIGLGIIGLIFDYFVSKIYRTRINNGMNPPWWIGGGRGGGMGGGFGGFGGGRSGGGGASGGW